MQVYDKYKSNHDKSKFLCVFAGLLGLFQKSGEKKPKKSFNKWGRFNNNNKDPLRTT